MNATCERLVGTLRRELLDRRLSGRNSRQVRLPGPIGAGPSDSCTGLPTQQNIRSALI
jgi:hypothetical protein